MVGWSALAACAAGGGIPSPASPPDTGSAGGIPADLRSDGDGPIAYASYEAELIGAAEAIQAELSAR